MGEDRQKGMAGALSMLYEKQILPLEKKIMFDVFHPMPMSKFDVNPWVLLTGPYSVGKTTMCESFIGRDYPGGRIGESPTTDGFVAIQYGEKDAALLGNISAVREEFAGLEKLGPQFLQTFRVVQVPCPCLKKITLIDTPGIQAGEETRRGFPFSDAVAWFAERAALILVLVDSHRLDISQEFKAVIKVLQKFQKKMVVILNKVDGMKMEDLMPVQNSLHWSLSQVMGIPEPPPIYLGSFRPHPLKECDSKHLVQKEMNMVLAEIDKLPYESLFQKADDLAARLYDMNVVATLLCTLRDKLPFIARVFHYNVSKERDQLIKDYDKIVEGIYYLKNESKENYMNRKDEFINRLQYIDFSELPSNRKEIEEKIFKLLRIDIPAIIASAPVSSSSSSSSRSDPSPSLFAHFARTFSNPSPLSVQMESDDLRKRLDDKNNAVKERNNLQRWSRVKEKEMEELKKQLAKMTKERDDALKTLETGRKKS